MNFDDTQLYRWTNQSGGAWVNTEEMRKELIEDGVLVLVERSYEAAEDALDDWLNDDLNDDERTVYEGAKAIVDAGYVD